MSPAERWRLLLTALDARAVPPPLVPQAPWQGPFPAGADPTSFLDNPCLPLELRLGAAVILDRPREVLGQAVETSKARYWQAVALRRCGSFAAARRAFRELAPRPSYPDLQKGAVAVLETGGPGYRWASTAAADLARRGTWDPVWFVDVCAAVHDGRLSRETAALLVEIQRVELRLMLLDGAAG